MGDAFITRRGGGGGGGFIKQVKTIEYTTPSNASYTWTVPLTDFFSQHLPDFNPDKTVITSMLPTTPPVSNDSPFAFGLYARIDVAGNLIRCGVSPATYYIGTSTQGKPCCVNAVEFFDDAEVIRVLPGTLAPKAVYTVSVPGASPDNILIYGKACGKFSIDAEWNSYPCYLGLSNVSANTVQFLATHINGNVSYNSCDLCIVKLPV